LMWQCCANNLQPNVQIVHRGLSDINGTAM
jgi:hypothetical protein